MTKSGSQCSLGFVRIATAYKGVAVLTKSQKEQHTTIKKHFGIQVLADTRKCALQWRIWTTSPRHFQVILQEQALNGQGGFSSIKKGIVGTNSHQVIAWSGPSIFLLVLGASVIHGVDPIILTIVDAGQAWRSDERGCKIGFQGWGLFGFHLHVRRTAGPTKSGH
ncbi:hypothetical protein OOU_Y34scaffold00522g23 [Pyricularia oryzae Y34]|uniref:Uncharacterized protein n=2 Tax=Pyricularia oryzae TaxID=318829 RepID=A0AA97NYY1_PYRO3|nr:hypothetical protein OOU_Y34scaffold00522g23 [Pyricularia oryzae Y34]